MEFAPRVTDSFEAIGGNFNGFSWNGGDLGWQNGFYRVSANTLSSNQITAVTLLNRIAYGPTPDELERVSQIGPDAYLAEQLAPETLPEDLDSPPPLTGGWRHVSVSGPGLGSSLNLYLEGQGEAFVDDVRLVAGSVDNGTQPNLVKDGDFESELQGPWTIAANYIDTARTTAQVHGGKAALHLVSGYGANGAGNSLAQTITPGLAAAKIYTLSFWYLPSASNIRLDASISGTAIGKSIALDDPWDTPAGPYSGLSANTASITDLRSWHLRHAIQSKRQLLEILRQFWENHFVTEYSKSLDYMSGLLSDDTGPTYNAVGFEFRENKAWREAMLNPQCTFYDLLKISAESPAMIIYLDTVLSRGDVSGGAQNIANENFARELCELFTFGVDNGYDQGDIVQISRAWTGWRVDLLAPGSENNPLSGRSKVDKPGVTNNFGALTNLLGTWTFRYVAARHDNRAKYLFFQKDASGNIITNKPKTVPSRFGAPWAGRPYGLVLTNGTGTNGISDGYQLIQHMANQPFTEEFISVKLCRLFVHENFHIGYTFNNALASPERDLVHACMMAWENPPNGGPKGQLRPVLKTIFDSALFRAYATSSAKVKTPLEYIASVMRALNAQKSDGSYTAATDTASDFQASLSRMGSMALFNRAEPNGYPEDGAAWISAGTLAERVRFVEAALMLPGMTARSIDAGVNTRIDPTTLLRLKIPQSMQDPKAVANYILAQLFPSEGAANLAAYGAAAVQYLNSTAAGAPSPFSQLSTDSAEYDTRVRGMTALLLASQRFQEQ